MTPQRAVVWFKRDLRVHDHAPLVAAHTCTDALAIFIIEPEWLNSPDCDASHVDFALACLTELRAACRCWFAWAMPLPCWHNCNARSVSPTC